MIATIVPDVRNHYPVLLSEIISIITPQYGGTFIDCTFGQGGYSKKILEFKNTKVIALDRDKDSEEKEQTSNGLENFCVEEESAPALFNSDNESSEPQDLLSTEINEGASEDDDLEIPAFLRRQKN